MNRRRHMRRARMFRGTRIFGIVVPINGGPPVGEVIVNVNFNGSPVLNRMKIRGIEPLSIVAQKARDFGWKVPQLESIARRMGCENG